MEIPPIDKEEVPRWGVAPAYANIFMGAFEDAHISGDEEFSDSILMYKRFIDDLLVMEGR